MDTIRVRVMSEPAGMMLEWLRDGEWPTPACVASRSRALELTHPTCPVAVVYRYFLVLRAVNPALAPPVRRCTVCCACRGCVGGLWC